MNNITCTIPNKRIEQLADKLKETTAVTNNMVSLWQTQNNNPTEYPTVAQLWELKKANNAIYKEARLAIPCHTKMQSHMEGMPIVFSSTEYNKELQRNVATLFINPMLPVKDWRTPFINEVTTYNGKNIKSDIYVGQGKAAKNINDVIETPKDAYMYALWREMHLVQSGITNPTESQFLGASRDALSKLVEFKKENPTVIIDTKTPQVQTQPVQQLQRQEIEKDENNINKSINERKASQINVQLKKFTEKEFNVNPDTINDIIVTDTKENSIFTAMGRTFILCDVNGTIIPFYQSSKGTSGKIKGNWYPFFGYTGNWLVKGDVDSNGKMSYSPQIDRVADLLNKDFKIPNDFDTNGKSESTGLSVEDLGLKMYTVFDRFGEAMKQMGTSNPDEFTFFDRDNNEVTNANALFVKQITGIKTEGIKQSHASGEFIQPFIDSIEQPQITPQQDKQVQQEQPQLTQPSNSLKEEENLILENPSVRIERSRLLNKSEVLDVHNTNSGITIAFKLDKFFTLPQEGADLFQGLLYKEKGRWRIQIRPKSNDTKINDLPKSTQDWYWSDEIDKVEPDKINTVLNSIVPKDLQDFLESNEYKEAQRKELEEQDAQEAAGKTLEERIDYQLHEDTIGPDAIIRDRWGIYFINQYTDEVNVLRKNNTQQTSQPQLPKSLTLTTEQVKQRIDEYDNWSKDHIKRDDKTHTYYIDGKPADYSVTQYIDMILQKTKPEGDHTYAQVIGNSVDAFVRDFFIDSSSVLTKEYPNLDATAKWKLLQSCQRLKAELHKKHGKNCKIITKEILLAANISTGDASYTVAGTMDMIVIDEDGYIWPYDMKAKNHDINTWDQEEYSNQLGGYSQLLETIFPEFKGRVKQSQLIWFSQTYPKQDKNGVHYSVNDKGIILVNDTENKIKNTPLQNYEVNGEKKWETPALKDNIQQSLIPLPQVKPLPNPTKLDIWEPQSKQQQAEQNANIKAQGEKGATPMPNVEDKSNPNVYDIPTPGLQRIRINTESMRVKLLKDISPTQIKDRTDMIANDFSDLITSIIEQKMEEISTEIVEEMKKPEEERDIEKLMQLRAEAALYDNDVEGRRRIIESPEYGMRYLHSRLKEQYQENVDGIPEDASEEDLRLKDEYRKVVTHFDSLFKLATPLIESKENFRVVLRDVVYNNGTTEEPATGGTTEQSSFEEDNFEDIFGDDENGQRTDAGGGITYKIRFVNPYTAMSRQLRKLLSNIVKLDYNGNYEEDDLGNLRYLNPEIAHAILLNEMSSIIEPDDFCIKEEMEDGSLHYTFPALEKMAAKYPWVRGLIEKLEEDDSLVSAFYNDLRMDFIPYYMQRYDEDSGQWKILAMNESLATDSVVMRTMINYDNGFRLSDNSIYSVDKKIIKSNVEEGLKTLKNITDLINIGISDDDSEWTEVTEGTAELLKSIGIESDAHIVANLLKTTDGVNSIKKVLNQVSTVLEKSLKLEEGTHLIDALRENYQNIAEEIGIVSELENVTSFRQGDKTYYSYSTPNYIDTMIKYLKSDSKRDTYLDEKFKRFEWFYKDGKWRNEWLRIIAEEGTPRAQLRTIELNSIATGEDSKGYEKWQPNDIYEGFIRQYFSIPRDNNNKDQYAYYHMPIFSDSPIVKFIRFKKYITDKDGTFKEKLLPLLREVVLQELDRQQLVKERIEEGAEKIGTFEKRGSKFCFFPALNNDKDFKARYKELKDDNDVDGINALIDETIEKLMDKEFTSFLEEIGSAKEGIYRYIKSEGHVESRDGLEDALEEYFWNQAFATTQIIQLTTTDLAFYKNGIDFQKRYKEVYASGKKLNTNSRYGKKIERTVYLADQKITSYTYTDTQISLNKALKEGRLKNYDVDNIMNKFRDINATDAQAYRSPESFRAVLDMMGKWDDKMERAFNNFENGTWTIEDFNIIWQTIKPFVFTQIPKPAHNRKYLKEQYEAGKITKEEYERKLKQVIKVPHQNKNSEFLILSFYSLVSNAVGKSPKLRALQKFMKDNDIDVVQFESAVKTGCQGKIDINWDTSNDYQKVRTILEEHPEVVRAAKRNMSEEDFNKLSLTDLFKQGHDFLLIEGKISQDEYNKRFDSVEPSEEEVLRILNDAIRPEEEGEKFKPEVVHEIPYDDYMVQQPTPEHLLDTTAIFGSQLRNLIIADIPEFNADGTPVIFIVNGKQYNKKQLINLYRATIVENLLQDFDEVRSRFTNIRKLQRALLDTIDGSSKLSLDVREALEIITIPDPNKPGEYIEVFNLPLDNPTVFAKTQEIILSMFKNKVTKQKIRGGNCIIVSDFGLTKELQLEKDETGRVVGVQCYMPAYSRDFFEPFMKQRKDGSYELDINEVPEELRKAIGYRIPTEDKYSMLPLIIKGFLPQQNGSCIMLPADITQIAGSDFDIDKLFLMLPEFKKYNTYDKKKAWKDFYEEHPEIKEEIKQAKWDAFVAASPSLEGELDEISEEVKKEMLKEFLKGNDKKSYEWVEGTQKKFTEWFDKNKDKYKTGTVVKKLNYDMEKEPKDETSKARRNNLLIDICYSILTHPTTAEKINNPGSFDELKTSAKMVKILSDKKLLDSFREEFSFPEGKEEELADFVLKLIDNGRLEDIEKFIEKYEEEKNPLSLTTFAYFHKQNMTGASLIGYYANNTTMQAKYQETPMEISDSFTFNGHKMQNLTAQLSPYGTRISKSCANFSAASVDNAKDPVLADLLQNENTANLTSLMLRLGMNISDISLVFAQPTLRNIIKRTDKVDLELIENSIGICMSFLGIQSIPNSIKNHNYTSKELVMNTIDGVNIFDVEMEASLPEGQRTISKDKVERELRMLYLIRNLAKNAEDLGEVTRQSRADSPNGAIATSIGELSMQLFKVAAFRAKQQNGVIGLKGVDGLPKMRELKFSPDKISSEDAFSFVRKDESLDSIREKLLKQEIPTLQAFFTLGIDVPHTIIGEYFATASEYLMQKSFDLQSIAGGYVSKRTMNSFFKEATIFALSQTKLLGDDPDTGETYEQKRAYYLTKFPEKFVNMITKNPALSKFDILRKISKNDHGELVFKKANGITPLLKETLLTSMDALLLDSNNPDAQELALELFKYAYYKYGLQFGFNSFAPFFSTTFITSIPEVADCMRQLRNNMKQGTFMDKYFMQFICNHIKEVIPSVGSKTKVITQGDNILIPASAASNPILGLNIYMSNQYKNTIYVLASDNAIIIDKHKYYTYKVAGNTIRKKGEPVRYNSNKEHGEMSADVNIRFKIVVPTSSEAPIHSYTAENLESIDSAMNYLNSREEPDIPDNVDDFVAPPHQIDDLSTSQMDEIDSASDNETIRYLEEDMQRNPDKYRAIDEYEYNGEPAINYDIDESEDQLSDKICEEP